MKAIKTRSLDLHGLRVPEALALVDELINQAVMNNIEQVEVVHGIGRGKIKQALHAHLMKLKVVKRYTLDDSNPGVTKIYL